MTGDFNQDELYFTINDVARQIGVVPATIRNWERQGLFRPKRAANGYRVFDVADLERLNRIKELSVRGRQTGVNALKALLGAQDTSLPARERTDARVEALVSKKLIGRKWRDYRLARGFPLESVARRIGISPSYLSRIENSQANNASFDILKKLARFYGENLLLYVQEPAADRHLVRRGCGEEIPIDLQGLRLESVVSRQKPTLSCLIYSVEPGCGRFEPYAHNGEEFVHVLKGGLAFSLNGRAYALKSGDSICFSSREEHSWHNPGPAPTRLLWVYTALTRF